MPLPAALEQNPLLSNWVAFEGDDIIVRTGKVELGQGIMTAIAIIAAEELSVPVTRITVRTGSTSAGPNEFITAGSMSIEGSGSAVRQACAEVRSYLLGLAAGTFGVEPGELTIEEGIIKHPATNETASFAELMDGQSLNIAATGDAVPVPVESYKLVGKTATRVDLLAKITGGTAYVQDLAEADTLHARIVRPPSMAYTLSTLNEIDKSGIEQMQGVLSVIVDGNFVAVLAEDEYTASLAKFKLQQAILWKPSPEKRLPVDIHEYLEKNAAVSLLVEQGTPIESTIPPRRTHGETLKATYRKPYHMHGSIGPSAATARWQGNKLYVRSHSQGPYLIRGALAAALAMPPEDIVVEHAENAGCYGHNGADDAAMDAAMVARTVPGKTVMLKWEREDEHAWEPYSPAMVMRMEASLENGKITHWNADIYSQSHSGRPIPHRSVSNLIAAWHKSNPMKRAQARPGMGNHSGIHRNADPIYDFPDRRIIKHLVTDQRVRTSSTRGLGAFGNVFAIESFMDELAHAASVDPVEFRLSHLSDPRAIKVINTAWQAASDRQPSSSDGWRHGRGLAFAQYKNRQTHAAVVVDLWVNETTLEIKLDHGIIAADSGQIIDRDGLANQLEGGLIQASSWTLKEAVQFDEFATTSRDWESYPILRFDEVPTVDVHLLDHPELPSVGAGEATQGPTPAAISNAVFNAVGVRLRQIPFTSDALRTAALAEEEAT